MFSLTNHARAGLYLDGKQVINNGGGFPGVTKSATVHLDAGTQHPIRVDWAKPDGQAMIELAWTPPAGTPNVGIEQAVAAAKKSDVAVVFASNKDTEGIDRSSLGLPGYQDALISAVAAANPHTVVVLDTGGPVTMPWLDDVAGVLEAWYPGEEDGNAAAAVLYGDVDPSGRLPITFPKSLADTPANTPAQYPGVNGVATYSEGLRVGYRHYDEKNIAPLFPFGYGLSYTTFSYSGLKAKKRKGNRATVSFSLKNTGTRSGAEVAQVYVGFPKWTGESPRQLKGFQKVELEPGSSKRVTVSLNKRAFSYWAGKGWRVGRGCYAIEVGGSSRSLPLKAAVPMGGGHCAKKHKRR
jgi:beta-glucosidase